MEKPVDQRRAEKIKRRIEEQKDKVVNALAEFANVTHAAKKTGVSRDTIYRWRKEDEDFQIFMDAAIMTGKSVINDLAHHNLIRKIQDGDMKAITFHLDRCHPDYGGEGGGVPYAPVTKINIYPYPMPAKEGDVGPDRAKILGEKEPPEGIVGNPFP